MSRLRWACSCEISFESRFKTTAMWKEMAAELHLRTAGRGIRVLGQESGLQCSTGCCFTGRKICMLGMHN